MHGRSRMTIDPRIPTMPGRSTSGFHRPGRHRLHQARSAVRCSASRMKGELHPAKKHFRILCVLSCIWMTASNEFIYFLVWPLPETAIGILCNCLVGALPYTHYVISSPLCGVRVLHSAQNDPTRPPSWIPPKHKNEKKKDGTLVV